MDTTRDYRGQARFLVSALIALAIWAAVSLGWLRNTIVPVFDQQFRDFYLSLTVDARPDEAPGLVHLIFDNEALDALDLPTRVPIPVIRDMLEVARHSVQAVVLDIDLATRPDIEAVDELAQYLNDWSGDPQAALLTLAYPMYEVPYRDQTAFIRIDEVVRSSPNIRWAGVGTFADSDGVIRNYEYWTCVGEQQAEGVMLLPSVAVYIWARNTSESAAGTSAAVAAGFGASAAVCDGKNLPELALLSDIARVPQSGIIEYQTSVDALSANAGQSGQFAADGFPRLMTIGYCRINPAACGEQASPADLAGLVRDRIVLVSAANDFSRDEHATPVGFMAGSVILGNAGRALINSGPPIPAPRLIQVLILLAAAFVIWLAWLLATRFRHWIRSHDDRPWLFKPLNGIFNPAVVQWLAFAAADVLILVYYYFSFGTSAWNGLIAASLGATTVAAIIAFNEWITTPWEQERLEDDA